MKIRKIKYLLLVFMFGFMLFSGRAMASEQTNTGTLDIRPGAADEDAYSLLKGYKEGLIDKNLIENILNSGGFSPSVADHVRTEMAAIDAANSQPATSAEQPTVAPTEQPTATPTEQPTAAPTEQPTVAPTEQPTAVPTIEPTAAPEAEAVPTSSPTAEKDAQAINEIAVALIGIFLSVMIIFATIIIKRRRK